MKSNERPFFGYLMCTSLLIVTVIGACATGSAGRTGSPGGATPVSGNRALPVETILSTVPIEGRPVFLGVSPRLKNRDDEMAVLLQSASIQAARYIRLQGEAAFYSRRTSFGTGYIQSVSIDDDFYLAADLESTLECVGVSVSENGSFGQFVLSDSPAVDFRYAPPSGASRPKWVQAIPEIEGYLVGVGTSRRNRLLADTIESADREALFSILARIAVEVTSDRFEVMTAGIGSTSGGSNLERARGEITGFYVLDRYIDEDGSVYTLALCPRKGNTE